MPILHSRPARCRNIAALAIALCALLVACGGSDGGFESFAVDVFRDPAAFDDVFAEAQAQKEDDEIVVAADITACGVDKAIATPQPDVVKVTVDVSTLDCDQQQVYRALFIVDAVGENTAGSWNYTTGAPGLVVITR